MSSGGPRPRRRISHSQLMNQAGNGNISLHIPTVPCVIQCFQPSTPQKGNLALMRTKISHCARKDAVLNTSNTCLDPMLRSHGSRDVESRA
ncbi:hypothetical protein SRHO_G00275680 [Serrasalmus rhombeus]